MPEDFDPDFAERDYEIDSLIEEYLG